MFYVHAYLSRYAKHTRQIRINANEYIGRVSMDRVYPDERVAYGPFESVDDAQDWATWRGIRAPKISTLKRGYREIAPLTEN